MSLDHMMKALMKLYRRVLDGIDPPTCRVFIPLSNVKKKARAFDSRTPTLLKGRFPVSWNAGHVILFSLQGLGGCIADMQHASPPVLPDGLTVGPHRLDGPSGEYVLCMTACTWHVPILAYLLHHCSGGRASRRVSVLSRSFRPCWAYLFFGDLCSTELPRLRNALHHAHRPWASCRHFSIPAPFT